MNRPNVPKNKNKKKKKVPNVRNPNTRIAAPAAFSGVNRTSCPRMFSSQNGDLRVKHRERIKTVYSKTTLTINSLELNPALTFPWLAALAGRYETYDLEQFSVEYVPYCPTSTAGVIVFAVDMDPADPDPVSFEGITSFHKSVTVPAWTHGKIEFSYEDCVLSGTHKFTRYDALDANLDIKMYDFGKLVVLVTGFATGDVMTGELYLNYTIVFHTPQLSINSEVVEQVHLIKSGAVNPILPFTDMVVIGGNDQFVTVPSNGNLIKFNQCGDYCVNLSGVVPTPTFVTPSLATFGSCLATPVHAPHAGSGGINYLQDLKVRVEKADSGIQLSLAPTVDSLSDLHVRISPMNYDDF